MYMGYLLNWLDVMHKAALNILNLNKYLLVIGLDYVIRDNFVRRLNFL